MQAAGLSTDRQHRTADESAPRAARHLILRLLLVAAAAVPLCYKITAPYTGWHEWNSAWYSYFARNTLRYGPTVTRGLCMYGDTAEPPADRRYYLHHPPLIATWVAIPMAVFGDHEWACRLVPIAATLGSIWLLMLILTRLGQPGLALLTGIFYSALPLTAYFGRMIDHVPLGQFFSLLMLHGYLAATGLYDGPARRRGWLWYTFGVLLGIGTAWAAAIPAGLIWCWHLLRAARGRAPWTPLFLLTLVPAAALAAVFAHILSVIGWNTDMLVRMFQSRSYGARPELAQPLSLWPSVLATHWQNNYTPWALPFVLVTLLAALTAAAIPTAGSPVRQLLRADRLRAPMTVLLLQGLLYVVVFKNQSWIHEYWQMFLTPVVALCFALPIYALFLWLRRLNYLLGSAVAAALTLGLVCNNVQTGRADDVETSRRDKPVVNWGFLGAWRTYHAKEHILLEYVDAYRVLADPDGGIPPFAPVYTFRKWNNYEDHFGDYVHKYTQPQIAYYARRPLIPEQDLPRILANEDGCAAFVLELKVPSAAQARIDAMAEQLRRTYETHQIGNQLIVYLQRPRGGQLPT